MSAGHPHNQASPQFDWQRFTQRSTATIARSEKKRFTGQIECRVCYRNAKARRGTVRVLTCAVLNRDPVSDRAKLLLPAEMIREMEVDLPNDGLPNEDSEISVTYHFFCGAVVDTRTELIQHL
jgi:hypothetical protein